MLALALSEGALVSAVPAERALESRIVGAPFLADSLGGQRIERSFCGSTRAVRARIITELAQKISSNYSDAARGRSRERKGREMDRVAR